ncbi:hypothetical protein H311_03228 [Anncaliia algerae PRA109]|nr:hypothetical protein H311_03228 [Anncaliia algerae PRA109]
MPFLFLFRGLITYLNALLSPSTLLVWKPMSGSLKNFEGFTVWCSKLLFKQAFFVCFQPSVEIMEPVRTYFSKKFCKVSSLRLLTRNYKHLLSWFSPFLPLPTHLLCCDLGDISFLRALFHLFLQ